MNMSEGTDRPTDTAVAAAAAAASEIPSESGSRSSKQKRKISAAATTTKASKTRRSPRLLQKEIDKKIWKTIFSIQDNERRMEEGRQELIQVEATNEDKKRDLNRYFDESRSEILKNDAMRGKRS